jgi:hypothetical protein
MEITIKMEILSELSEENHKRDVVAIANAANRYVDKLVRVSSKRL